MWKDRKAVILIVLIILLVILGESLRHDDHEGDSNVEIVNPFASQAEKPKTGSPVPTFSLPSTSGNQIGIEQFKGKAVLVNFWATWCAPCLVEMPLLQTVSERHKDELIILAINSEESMDSVKPFLEKNHLTFPILMDEEGKVANMFGIYGYPVSFFVDKQGIIRSLHYGQLNKTLLTQNLLTIGIDTW